MCFFVQTQTGQLNSWFRTDLVNRAGAQQITDRLLFNPIFSAIDKLSNF